MLNEYSFSELQAKVKMAPFVPQIMITSTLLDQENNHVPEITITREMEVAEAESTSETSPVLARTIYQQSDSIPDSRPRMERFISERLARLGLGSAPSCRWGWDTSVPIWMKIDFRCIEVLERLEQRLECPVCLATNVGQVFQCHRFLSKLLHGLNFVIPSMWVWRMVSCGKYCQND